MISLEDLNALLTILERVWFQALSVVTLLLDVTATLHVLLHKRPVSAKLAWIGLILLSPIVGAALYTVFGINRIVRRATRLRAERGFEAREEDALVAAERASNAEDLLDEDGLLATSDIPDRLVAIAHTTAMVTGAPLLGGNEVTMLRDGDEAYPKMLEAIEAAQRSITMTTYIFDADEWGERFVEALAAAHERGVAVHVLIDAIGMWYSWPTSARKLRARGVDARAFLPLRLRRFAFLNLRLHRKVMVIDGTRGFTGGINIRGHHVIASDTAHPTHDVHFAIEGPVVWQLQRSNVEDWYFTTGVLLEGDAYFARTSSEGSVYARGIIDGPDEDFESLRLVMQSALRAARERVVIITPYFIPDEALVSALEVCATSGVVVDIILPAASNLRFVDWASRPLWGTLLERGCRIWLVSESSAFDHAKLMTVDGAWSLIGSANWDPRSLKLNFEFNMECYDSGVAAGIDALAARKLEGATRWTLQMHQARPGVEVLRDELFHLGAPYL
ncbi:MAG: phospholipase D-like domain-containing protein [Myxococcota bacterium]